MKGLFRSVTLVGITMLMLASPVVAQQRPVLTKNIDEPARNPFQQTIVITAGPGAIFQFQPVPLGKRLVVTYASVHFGAYTYHDGPAHGSGPACLATNYPTGPNFGDGCRVYLPAPQLDSDPGHSY